MDIGQIKGIPNHIYNKKKGVIDAPAGVTINAVAGESGTYTLASGGTLILKAS